LGAAVGFGLCGSPTPIHLGRLEIQRIFPDLEIHWLYLSKSGVVGSILPHFTSGLVAIGRIYRARKIRWILRLAVVLLGPIDWVDCGIIIANIQQA
jgi:hypothetical protein